jgi:hypothetical protein
MKKRKKAPEENSGVVKNIITLNPPEKIPPKNVNEIVNKFFEKRQKAIDEKIDLSLKEKAEKHQIEEDILKTVYQRGISSYSFRPSMTKEQYAMNRVNSFLAGGISLLEDYDLIPINEAPVGGAARPHILRVGNVYNIYDNKGNKVHTAQTELQARMHLAQNRQDYIKNEEYIDEAQRGTVKAKRPGTGGAARPHVKIERSTYNPNQKVYSVYDATGNKVLSTQDQRMAYNKLDSVRRKMYGMSEEISKNDPRSRFEGTKSLVKIYKKDTPGEIKEDLRNWFNPSHPEGGWKRINSKGEAIGPCAREPGEPKPKCMSNEKRAKLSQSERASAVRAKRTHDPVADRSGKGGKPVNVSNFGKGKISEEVSVLEEANKPTNPSLWSRAKSLARSKFDVYPSAYANGWAAKWYKSKGGGWKSKNEELEYVDEGKKDILNPQERDRATILGHIKRDGWTQQKSGSGGDHDKFKHELTPESHISLPRHRTLSPGVARTIVKQIHDVKAKKAQLGESAAWQRKEGKDPEGGLNRKGIASYRRENPGSKLSMAVTTKPSKLKPGSKSANRRKSFCARMSGMKRRLTSAKTARDPDSRINKALRKWNC